MIRVALRNSPLSLAQSKEVFSLLPIPHELIPLQSAGDKDKIQSLRNLDKSDFFTREIDEEVIKRRADIAIHAAKDLPSQLPEPLHVIALTKGLASEDSLVLKESVVVPRVVATSSLHREKNVRKLFPDCRFVDLRGTIGERLSLLERGAVDGVVVAEAALIRLGLAPKRIFLLGETAPYQGKLAIVARRDRIDMEELFSKIDGREKKGLYFGLRVPSPLYIHAPLIEIEKLPFTPHCRAASHIIFTSQTAVDLYHPYIRRERLIAIGEKTAASLRREGFFPDVAKEESQEGVIELLSNQDLQNAHFVIPGSLESREKLFSWLLEKKISYERIVLYRPKAQEPNPKRNLADYSPLIFTSPSQVAAFRTFYGQLPPNTKLEAIGPITKMALRNSFPSALIDLTN